MTTYINQNETAVHFSHICHTEDFFMYPIGTIRTEKGTIIIPNINDTSKEYR